MYKSLTILLFLIFRGLSPSIGQSYVQTSTLYQVNTSKTISRTFAASSTTGNLIIVHLDWDGQTRSINSVTDNKGNAYTRINGPTNWNGVIYRAELWYAYNITGSGAAIAITATLSGAPTSYTQIYISEYSGIARANPLDQNSAAMGNALAVSSGSQTTAYTNELIYGASIGASGLLTLGAGFTIRSTANSNIIEDKISGDVGSFNTTFNSAGGNWVAQMATFITASSLILLPMDILSFSGECTDNQVVLEWTTALETNNDYFSIESSQDGNIWQVLRTVKGVGNSSVNSNYSFTTDQTNNEFSFYRIKQTDDNGISQYFNIIRVNTCIPNPERLIIYPNPSNGKSLSGKFDLMGNADYSILIFDNHGKTVNLVRLSDPAFMIRFPLALPSGIYYVRVSCGTYSSSKIFLVEN
jgi:hypothetical protein